MRRSFLFHLLVMITLVSLILAMAGTQPVLGMTNAAGRAELTFGDLNMTSPKTLIGPVSEYALQFNLPVDWQPNGTATLQLDFSAFFSSLVPTESTSSISGLIGGELSLTLNGTLLTTQTLQVSGDQTLQIEFDSALLTLPARGSLNELRIRWDGSMSCQMNLLSSVTIQPTSTIRFTYGDNPQAPTLNDFPVPFLVENAIQPVPLVVILPDEPSLSEIRAGLIIMAGLGQMSAGETSVEMLTLSQANAQVDASGEMESNSILVSTSDRLFTVYTEPAPGDGLIQFEHVMKNRFLLVISGDDTGIIKAAQVLSAGQIAVPGDAKSMVVSAVNPAAPIYGEEDMTLEALGVGELVFSQQNGLEQSFDFLIPAGEQARADAAFRVILSHSQQLDYLRSGLQIKLNGYPAISFRLTDATSNQTLFTVILPSNLIHPGRNTVELVTNLKTRDLCTPADESIAWIRVSASSTLHLPLESAVESHGVAKTFGDFPDAFLSGSGLDNIIFVLSPANFENVKAAGILAYTLGAALPQAQPLQPQVVTPETFDPALAGQANVILVGKPLDFSILDDKEAFPSLVFEPDNTLSEASNLTTVIKPDPNADTGYLAIRGYEAQSSRILLAVLGNNPAALLNAVATITDRDVSSSNFAYVVGQNERANWLDPGIASGAAAPSAIQATPVPEIKNTAQKFQMEMLGWVIPVLVILVAILVLIIYMEIRSHVRKE